MRHAWTTKEEELLSQTPRVRSSILAKIIGVSTSSVNHHRRRMDIFKFKWSPEKISLPPKPKSNYVWGNNIGQPCPPPSMDLMHRDEYKPAPWEYARDGAGDACLLPSRQPEAAASYRDRSHP